MNINEILPIGKPASALAQHPPNLRPRILVVEDDVDIRRLNVEVLLRAGYQVDAAKDGAVAWDALQLVNYDLLITDNNMPGVTGLELLKRIHAAQMELPVLMATGTLPTWEFSVYPWLQPTAVLLKPYTIAELLETVNEVFQAANPDRERIAPPSWQDHLPTNDLRHEI